jgi:hypothetical protein
MQEATKDLPVQELDIPSQYLKLQVKMDGRSYNGKESARIAQEWADFRKPLPSKEPQKPPINAPPPPIYGPPRNNPPLPYRSTCNQPQQPVSGQPLAAGPTSTTAGSTSFSIALLAPGGGRIRPPGKDQPLAVSFNTSSWRVSPEEAISPSES